MQSYKKTNSNPKVSEAYKPKIDFKMKIESKHIAFNKLINKNEDDKSDKKKLLNAFAKKPIIATPIPIIQERSEKTKQDSYTYDLDEVLKNTDIKTHLKDKDKKPDTSKTPLLNIEKVNNDQNSKIEKKEKSPEKIDNVDAKAKSMHDIIIDNEKFSSFDEAILASVKRKNRNNLMSYLKTDFDNFTSFTSKLPIEMTLSKKFKDKYDDEDPDLQPAYKHKKKKKNDSIKQS